MSDTRSNDNKPEQADGEEEGSGTTSAGSAIVPKLNSRIAAAKSAQRKKADQKDEATAPPPMWELDPAHSAALPEGYKMYRSGNLYLIKDKTGNVVFGPSSNTEALLNDVWEHIGSSPHL